MFLESSGELLGFVPFGSSLISRRDAYPGLGQLYRIDFVCRQSKLLKEKLPACRL